jgi:UDP-N-acetylglucosamine--N-acetylmuramyl-(pentapeptide) pyrophosphoryl-undecaprenol N-acetylglucosamine transferase
MKRILFCGGGSAGHVMPNVALIQNLKTQFDICYIGTGGIEREICVTHGIKFYEFDAVKLVRGKVWCNIAIPFKLIKSINQAKKIIKKLQPDLLFCKGGYVCVPAAFAAHSQKVPIITHESDLTVGLANRIIAPICKSVLCAFPNTANKIKNGKFVGTPMRDSLFNRSKSEAKAHFVLDDRKTIIVFGGGSGSTLINNAIRSAAPLLCKKYNILHICGKGNKINSSNYGYYQFEFVDDMGLIFACADCAVARCGANSAFELIALKIPTLFIPLQNGATRGDQVKNAEYFKENGLCHVLKESELNPERLTQKIENVLDDKKLKTTLESFDLKRGNEKIINEIKLTLQ